MLGTLNPDYITSGHICFCKFSLQIGLRRLCLFGFVSSSIVNSSFVLKIFYIFMPNLLFGAFYLILDSLLFQYCPKHCLFFFLGLFLYLLSEDIALPLWNFLDRLACFGSRVATC